jgi:polysaccharide chain length determinant protein (PEP-CTERM system associated)
MDQDRFTPVDDRSFAVRALEILRRRRMLVVATFMAVLAGIVSCAVYLPDLYGATAMVLVERPLSESVVRPAISGEVESRLAVIKQEILSRDRLTRLIERFNLYSKMRREASLEEAVQQMRRDIEVRPEGPEQISGRNRTVAFSLTYTGNSPTTAAEVVNAIAAFYVAQNDRMRSEEAIRTTQFLRTQLDQAKRQLDRHEQSMRSYTARYMGEMPQQVGVNLATLERLNTQLRLNGEQQLRTIDQRDMRREAEPEPDASAAAVKEAVASGPQAEELSADLLLRVEQLEKLKQELASLELMFASRHPDVVRMKDQIATLEQETELQRQRESAERRQAEAAKPPEPASQPTAAPPAAGPRRGTSESLEADLARLRTEEATIRQSIAEYERRLESTPERQQDYNLVSRDYQAAKELYDSLFKRYEEAQLAESVETDRQGERFRVLEPAVAPEGPVAPNRFRLFILGILLAAAAAAVAVTAAEQLDTSFRSVDELREFTTVPVLAMIPRIGPKPVVARLRVALATVSALAAIVLIATISAYIARDNEMLVRLLARAG